MPEDGRIAIPQARFADYVQLMAQALGDRVSDWMIFNEPDAFVDLGHLEGTHAPGRKSMLDFLRATHVVNLAQGEGFRALKAARPSARVGTAFSMSPCEPATDSEEDKLAAERAHAITNTWFLEPALRGRYPDALAFLPETAMRIESGDMEKTRAPLDFIGINLYYRTIASAPGTMERFSHTQEWLFPVKMDGGQQGPKTDFGWEVWPKALYDMVTRITRDYNRPVIEITESGCSYNDGPDASGAIHDSRRIEYHREYLAALARSIAEGADVRGYHAWSLLDNFEWAEGFSQRFGLTYVDFKTQQRTIKDSGRWYGKGGDGESCETCLNWCGTGSLTRSVAERPLRSLIARLRGGGLPLHPKRTQTRDNAANEYDERVDHHLVAPVAANLASEHSPARCWY